MPSLVAELRAIGCVFAEDEARILLADDPSPAQLSRLVARRAAGVPLEHLVGWVEFCGLRIGLDPGVFIPRRRSEWLVHEAARLVAPDAVVLDLCCGSGALALALLNRIGGRELHAADVDPAAVRCARRNLEPIGGRVYEGDLFDPLPATLRGRVGLLLANVPYVPTDALPLMPGEARVHEPLITHDGGADGLDVLRRVLVDAPEWLAPGGHLVVEIYRRQTERAVAGFAAAGLDVEVRTSQDRTTAVIGTQPPSSAAHGSPAQRCC